MLVFKEFENNEFSILDTEDNVIESISGEELLNILCTTDLEIQGLSLNSKGYIVNDTKTVLYKPVKAKNSNLTKARKAKNDEFYTQLSDIEKELSHYPIETFKDKVIYCPMDVATSTGKILQSKFVKYFQLNAHRLQFKKLIATCLVDKAAGDGVALDDAQNCYILERKSVDSIQRNIYGYTHGDGNSNPVIDEVDDFGLKYKTKDENMHAIPYHIVNQAVTDSSGKIVLVKKYIDHYDEMTGKPVLSDENKGLTWMFEGYSLSIKWCRKHLDGTIEMLPDECYFLNNNDIISDFSVFPKDEDGNPCFENTSNGSVCLAPSEYYDYQEVDYNDYEEYFSHCPEDSSEFGGSGDFRSEYCTRLLQEADIVVTNPSFSLFRAFIAWIMQFEDKKFITLADQNCIIYKEVFPLFKDNKMWTGTQTGITSMMFEVPECYPVPDYAYKWCKKHTDADYFSKHRLTYLRGVSWFTNVDIAKRHENLTGLSMQDLIDKGVEFHKYDNYDAIDVSKIKEIPMDYDEVMGVPITFLYQYNPDQFEIVGISCSLAESFRNENGKLCSGSFYINGKRMYARIVIRHRKNDNGELV